MAALTIRAFEYAARPVAAIGARAFSSKASEARYSQVCPSCGTKVKEAFQRTSPGSVLSGDLPATSIKLPVTEIPPFKWKAGKFYLIEDSIEANGTRELRMLSEDRGSFIQAVTFRDSVKSGRIYMELYINHRMPEAEFRKAANEFAGHLKAWGISFCEEGMKFTVVESLDSKRLLHMLATSHEFPGDVYEILREAVTKKCEPLVKRPGPLA